MASEFFRNRIDSKNVIEITIIEITSFNEGQSRIWRIIILFLPMCVESHFSGHKISDSLMASDIFGTIIFYRVP